MPNKAQMEFIADTPFGGMKGTEPKAPYVPKFTPELTFAPSPSTYSLPGVDDGFLSSLATLGEDGEEPELDPKKPLLALVWKDLAVAVRANGKVLLNYVAGRVTEGFYAVMGPSGSGKTTLLNTLACRLDRAVKVSGYMHINGKNFTRNDLKKIASYVMQDDLLNAYMTVQETLKFAAELRLPKDYTMEQRMERCAQVAEAMDVKRLYDVIIGNALMKGVSGGERKRVSVAMELLTKPILLFLDEPTSGLDSVMSLHLCTKLRALADAKTCTIVTTIHQPQAKIYDRFTNLMLLKAGNIMYQGFAADAIPFYESLGAPVPSQENPADHFMDAMSSPEFSDRMAAAYKAPDVDLQENSDQPVVATPKPPLPWITQFNVLLARALKEQWRKRAQLGVQIAQSFVIAVLLACAFRKLDGSNRSQRNRTSSLWSCIVNQGIFGALAAINSFPSERALALRERAAGMYCASAYFMAKSAADLWSQTITPVIFVCTMYFIIGYQATAQKFFFFMALITLTNMAACSLGLAVSAIARRIEWGMVILPMAFEICRLYGSYFLSPRLTPKWLQWIDVLSFAKYGHIGIVINEFTGLRMSDYTPSRPIFAGNWSRGEDFLDDQGYYGYLTRGNCCGILFGWIIAYRAIAFAGIRYLKH